jgi:hypothetical protein
MSTHVKRKQPASTLRASWVVGGLLLVGAGLASSAFGQAGTQGGLAPLVNTAGKSAIPDHYIVVLKPGVAANGVASAQGVARNAGGTIGFTYGAALRGFSVAAPPAAIDRLRALPEVAYVEVDSMGEVATVQPFPPAGLDRTSERLRNVAAFPPTGLDNRYTYSETGAGVHAYVIDTGIRTTHLEFEGRASGAFTSIFDGMGTNDCNGHGTHVAGTIGAHTYGMAKNVSLHAVRVLPCSGSGPVSNWIAGVDWVTANAIHPAVANMSLQASFSMALNDSITASIASGVTYAVAAGNFGVDACGISPASTPNAITVGNIDPRTDTRWTGLGPSDFGPCLDLFGPGVNILSTWASDDGANALLTGTSMASPHVAGAAARYLQTHPGASPADVWNRLRFVADVHPGTVGWPGIVDPGAGSPDRLLHYGSRDDGLNDGDPHMTTVGGVRYDFQGAGEFVMLRDRNGLEIQTRQTPVETTFGPVPDPYTGLSLCPSINTAVAARVGTHRISFEPEPHGEPTPDGLQLRIDGVLTSLGGGSIDLGPDARVASFAPDGIEVTFPDGTTLIATPHHWVSEDKWYLFVRAFHSIAREGLLGDLGAGSWLPALPDGSSLGPRPADLHQRYLDINTTFANAWRVSDATSLFDYAPGTSTATYTIPSWPPEQPPCILPNSNDPPVDALDPATAQKACSSIVDQKRRANCIYDVQATGDTGFAKAYQVGEAIVNGSTTTLLDDALDPTQPGTQAVFTATVARNAAGGNAVPVGTVQLVIDGKDVGAALKLDGGGHAAWALANLQPGVHQIAARYAPAQGSVFLPSTSLTRQHTVQ